MKIKELNPGLYKIQKVDPYRPSPHSKGQTVRLLRVTGYGDKRLYFIDNYPGVHPSKIEDDYEVLSRYDGLPNVDRAFITVTFTDGAGQEFKFSMRSVWALKGILEEMPWLKKPLGYLPRKR